MLGKAQLISVVIPVFNGERFLREAIESVLGQENVSVECIVVDDGSTDNTSSILREYEHRITALAQPNRGVAAARNAGAASATGSILAFLDADDSWDPDHLRLAVDALCSENVALAYTGLRLIDEAGCDLGLVPAPPADQAVRNTLLLEAPVVSVAQAAVLRKASFDAVGGFDPRLSTSADCDLVCRLGLRERFARVDRCTASYRLHGAQMHLDVGLLQRDMRVIFERTFADPRLPQALRVARRRAEANLRYTVGATLLRAGDPVGLFHLATALTKDPRRTWHLLWRNRARRSTPVR